MDLVHDIGSIAGLLALIWTAVQHKTKAKANPSMVDAYGKKGGGR